MPKRKQKSDLIADSLRRKRKHRHKWPEPEAEIIFGLHTAVHSHNKKSFHAELTLEIPQSETVTIYYTISATHPTEAGAMRAVIQQMEQETWFHHFRKRGVRFKVTGVMETIYRGYL